MLISGPTGTGKELLAQGIHNASSRRQGPFVAINCGALPESLLESELFGYEEGAFTGARKHGRSGLFEAAHCGTIFLDEVAELPLLVQTRLLRVLQEREVMRVGGTRAIPIDVRVIAATHRNLIENIALGSFRHDLFYRLSALRVDVPPLCERFADLATLAKQLIDKSLSRVGLVGQVKSVIFATLPLLEQHPWPGNVRELENFAERVAIACLEAKGDVSTEEIRSLLDEVHAGGIDSSGVDLSQFRRTNENDHILSVLAQCGGNQVQAARLLGISRSTLWRKLRATSN